MRLRTTLLTLLAGSVLALALVVASPGRAGASHAQTAPPVGSPTNPDGTSGPPVETVAPLINRHGTVPVGARLNCTDGTWANDPTSYRVRWRRRARLVHTGTTYTVTKANAGSVLSCYVAATNAQGTGAALGGTVKVKGPKPKPKRHARGRP